ncbi:LAETG motif-containing sortase-dependent surface protein [Streptomyces sp. C36]|uniref:LAETG motif-containing sortase-dependent surface protein n=1 Tax=Streptomyces sp. C36 TaxID=3237122 RepID=UPI0034C66AA0
MKLSRITAVAAAAVIAPAAFLAAPATAATGTTTDVQKPAVTAPDATTPDHATGPAPADGTKKTDQAPVKATVKLLEYPRSFTAGGDWTEFGFIVDNTAGSQAIEPLRLTFMLSGNGEKKIKSTQRIEYRAKDGSWIRIDDKTPGSTFVGSVTGGKVEKGQSATVELRVKLSADYPTGPAHALVDISGTSVRRLSPIDVVAKGGAAKPSPSTGGETKSPTPSGSAKPSPSGTPSASTSVKPSASASARVSAAPSASASSPAAAAVADTSAQGGGDSLATTGAGNSTPWVVGAAALAVAAGAGLVVMTRRRLSGR